ncbi:MAG: hypothetical protein ABJB11_21275, partial [Ferruginibacter sp.]
FINTNILYVSKLNCHYTRGILFSQNSVGSRIEGVDNTGFASYQPLSLKASYLSFETTSEAMRILNNGNVGIGTTTPFGQLSIAGTKTSGAWGTNGPSFDVSSNLMDNTSSGTVGTVTVLSSIHSVYFNATSPTTYTHAATLFLGVPTPGTNVGITNAYSLYASGSGYFGGTLVGNNISSSNIVSATTGFYGGSIRSAGTNSIFSIQGIGAAASGTGNLKHLTIFTGSSANTKTAGNYVAVALEPTYNQTTGTAANTDFLINRTETAIGSGAQLLLDAQVGGTSKFNISRTGQGYFAGNVGIGITSPSAQLHVVGTARFASLANDDTLSRLLVSDASGNLAYRNVATLNTGGTWGSIGGSLTSQADLQNALNLKAPLNSAALTGIPTTPTGSLSDSSLQIANTSWVSQKITALASTNFANSDLSFTDNRTHNGANKTFRIDSLKSFTVRSETFKIEAKINPTNSFRATMYRASDDWIWDGVFAEFNNNYSNYPPTLEDVYGTAMSGSMKFYDARIGQTPYYYTVMRKRPRYEGTDTAYLALKSSEVQQAYYVNMMPNDGNSTSKFYSTATLYDNYTGITTAINTTPGSTTRYNFSIDGNAASKSNTRLRLIMQPVAPWSTVIARVDSATTAPTEIIVTKNDTLMRYPISLLTAGGSNGWGLTGNGGTNSTSNFIGTTDNVDLVFRTNNVNKMLINATGNVGIGTSQVSDVNYKLFVETGIRTRKIKVDAANVTWPDYVFNEDHKMPTLDEVEKFIQLNKHLPGVQSAAEVEKNGIDLAENQAVLLQKIEELTLYVIEQNKKIRLQQDEINSQSKTESDLQSQISLLQKQFEELKSLLKTDIK